MNKIGYLMALCLLSSCSSQAVYNNIQINNRTDCSQGPPSEFEECFKRTQKSFEEYEQERKADKSR
ncbi:hypothetical protein [Marinicella gelatinilytica]|uniref:hypothetical protein n=1 Tax=Marinicella gelatinilytica TaxID=2996017 RepID=UPI0022609E20|nr:hypothetical protein [Marinicella gelatinilytica]MCX7545488.1 hypothetical protein [Marinicella gelatinilytica]